MYVLSPVAETICLCVSTAEKNEWDDNAVLPCPSCSLPVGNWQAAVGTVCFGLG